MLKCKECGKEFEEEGEAMDHVIDSHADICDRKLKDYIGDSQKEAYDEIIEASEDHF